MPSQWDKWNADAALGWTPDDHTRVELTAGTGDGYARYAGRGMDGAHFRRETFGLSFDKRHLATCSTGSRRACTTTKPIT